MQYKDDIAASLINDINKRFDSRISELNKPVEVPTPISSFPDDYDEFEDVPLLGEPGCAKSAIKLTAIVVCLLAILWGSEFFSEAIEPSVSITISCFAICLAVALYSAKNGSLLR